MGQEITYSHFDAGDIERYHQKIEHETHLLAKLIAQKAFSKRSPIAGFEV